MKIPNLVVVLAFVAMFVSAQLSVSANAQSSRKPPPKRVKGTVKWFNDAKGIGYVTSESGKDLFYEKASANGYTIEGECVTFEVGTSPKGPVAKRVRGCPGVKRPILGPVTFPSLPKP